MDEPGYRAAAPCGRIHDAVLQHAAVLRSGHEVADILDPRGDTLLALDDEDLLEDNGRG